MKQGITQQQAAYLSILKTRIDRDIVKQYAGGMTKREIHDELAPTGTVWPTPVWGIVNGAITRAIGRNEVEPQPAEAELLQQQAEKRAREEEVAKFERAKEKADLAERERAWAEKQAEEAQANGKD